MDTIARHDTHEILHVWKSRDWDDSAFIRLDLHKLVRKEVTKITRTVF